MSEPVRERAGGERLGIRVLAATEHVVFFIIGALLFIASLALLAHAALSIVPLFETGADAMQAGTRFLDLILLVLMVVELAYTVLLSLRGAVLVAEPFLIVGLIAVIRRILVITVGEPRTANVARAASSATLMELGVLTAVVLVFVGSILLLRLRRRSKADDHLLTSGE